MSQWKAVPDYEGLYEVSDEGQVRSMPRQILDLNGFKKRVNPACLKSSINTHGYKKVNLSKSGKAKTVCVHVLVARAFLGPAPAGMEVCHGDGNRLNNSIGNLRYGTRAENIEDRIKHGTSHRPSGEKNPNSRLTVEDVKAIRESTCPQKDIAKRHNIERSVVSKIKSGQRWTHI